MNSVFIIIFNFFLLFLIWFTFWYCYNFLLLPKGYSTEKTPLQLSLIFLILSVVCIAIGFGQNSFDNLQYLFPIVIIAIAAYLIKKREAGRIMNTLFQMSWLFAFTGIFQTNFVLLMLIFFGGHLPAFLVKHLHIQAKVIIMILAALGALVFSLILTLLPTPISFFSIMIIHYLFYAIFRPWDHKWKLNLVN
ncbi:MAG: hypothetical protein WCJ58_07770 [bacterium]